MFTPLKRHKNLFSCTKCGRECSHVTTSLIQDGRELVDDGESLCAWCVTRRRDGLDRDGLSLDNFSREQIEEIARELGLLT